MQFFIHCNFFCQKYIVYFTLLTLLGQYCARFLRVQCCPKSINTTLNKIFHVQCCLEAIGQHCTRFSLVHCCHKRIKDNIEQDFFLWNVVWSSRTTLPRVFTRAMFSQEY